MVMSISICSSCLSRLRISSRTRLNPSVPAFATQFAAPFHTSQSKYATPVKKKGAQTLHKHREATSVKVKKKQRDRPKPPAIGERKAARKRIVLSNTNAADIPGMQNLSTENLASPETVGQVLGLDGQLIDQLRDAKAFKTTQNWKMFRRPATLMRNESIALGKELQCFEGEKSVKLVRKLITGEKHSGKSTLLQQAMCMAFLKKWVVINIPECQDFTINQSSYAPLSQKETSSSDQLYIQPQLTADILSRAAYANDEVLKSLKITQTHAQSLGLKKGMSLKDLALLGAQDPSLSWPAWQAFWKELAEPHASSDAAKNPPRPPVLVAIDGIDHWMGPTKYKSTDYNAIHSHQFTMISKFVSLLFSSNRSTSEFNGMILASTSASNTPAYPTFNLLLRELIAQASGVQITDPNFPMPSSYSDPDQRVLDLFQPESAASGPQVMNLKGLTRLESKGLLEYYANSGILAARNKVTDGFVAEKWTLSSGGNIGELEKLGKRLLA